MEHVQIELDPSNEHDAEILNYTSTSIQARRRNILLGCCCTVALFGIVNALVLHLF